MAAGAGAAAGAATMTSPLTATTISTAIPTSAAATELPNYPLARVALAVLEAWVVLAASGGWEGPVVPVASAAQGALVVLAASVVQATVRRSYLPAVIPGNITRSTVAALLTLTEPLPIGLVARHAAIPWRIGR